MSLATHRKVLIIGSGPAGYTAALYAARASLDPLLIEGLQPGGQMTITTDVENWPGEVSVTGPELMARMADQARRLKVDIVSDTVVHVDLFAPPFVVVCDSGARYTADTVVVATGASARWLGLPSEDLYRGGGVSACATCDGFFFRGRTVAVVGGGNTAVEEALYLANIASKVYLVHRRNRLRADQTNQARLRANADVEMVWNAEVVEVLGDGTTVTGLRVRDTLASVTTDLAVDGLFVAIGHDPATALFRGQLEMDADGYISVRPGSTATSIPGVFAAGDVQDRHFRQAVTSAAMGCMAALEAERYLNNIAIDSAGTPPAGMLPDPRDASDSARPHVAS